MRLRMWFIDETDKARLYSRVPSSRSEDVGNRVWIPRSVVEHTTKRPAHNGEKWPEHELIVADWFAQKEGL
jgi:hypothetical protein